jgi:hypothetical protein
MVWQPAGESQRQQWYRLGLLALVVATGSIAFTLAGTSTAGAQSDLSFNDLNVSGVNKTVEGNVTGATVQTQLDYKTDVPGADRRVIRLEAGPTANNTVALDYNNSAIEDGTTQGTVTLSGDVFRHKALNTTRLTPARGETTTTEIVVAAEITMSRPEKPDVTRRITEPVTLTLTDDGGAMARLGGSGSVTINTTA